MVRFSTFYIKSTSTLDKFSQQTPSLGLVIYDELKRDQHINKLSAKLNSIRYKLRVLVQKCDNNTTTMIDQAYFHTSMSYGLAILSRSIYGLEIFELQRRVSAFVRKTIYFIVDYYLYLQHVKTRLVLFFQYSVHN